MKKMFEVLTNSVALNAESAANKTHWFVHAVDTALKMIGVNNASFSYITTPIRLTMTIGEQSFELKVPTITMGAYGQGDKYLFYVNTIEKVIFGIGSMGSTYDVSKRREIDQYYPINYLRGFASINSTQTGNAPYQSLGGYLSIKIKNGTVKCYSNGKYAIGSWPASHPTTQLIGIVLPSNYKAETTPIQPVRIRFQKAPVIDSFIGNSRVYNLPSFEGEYFDSVFICQQFFIGSLKTSDNKRFVYGGYMFDVDDAMDIGVIEATV